MQYQPMQLSASEQTTQIQMQKMEDSPKKIIQLNIDPNRPKYGKMCVLINRGFFHISLGPDYICFIFAFIFFCAIDYLLCITVSNSIQNQSIIWITIILSVAQCGSYLLVAISDPSIALKENNPIKVVTQENRYKVCGRCGAQSKRRTYHCRQCDVCIEGYDHHCPWTSKCIGKGNLKRFYAFVTITPIYILLFIGLMMACLIINAKHISAKNHLKMRL